MNKEKKIYKKILFLIIIISLVFSFIIFGIINSFLCNNFKIGQCNGNSLNVFLSGATFGTSITSFIFLVPISIYYIFMKIRKCSNNKKEIDEIKHIENKSKE